jgi:RNA polymerase sporulation-specific sigma factor
MNESVGTDSEGNEIALMDLLKSDDGEMIDDIDNKYEAMRLRQVIDTVLTSREKQIIELRFGLVTGDEMTQKQVGKLMNLSRSYISRLEHSAIEKIKKQMG